jgi:hypothetical protein
MVDKMEQGKRRSSLKEHEHASHMRSAVGARQ